MGKVVNLRTVKKQKKREDSRARSNAATSVSGIKKTERNRVTSLNKLAERNLDGHKRDK